MIQFEYNGIMKRHDVKVPFVLAEEQDMVMVASISEENKVTLHREVSLRLLKQIILQWDEYEHQMIREFEIPSDESQLRVIDGANKKKGK